MLTPEPVRQTRYQVTLDGRYFVVRGRLWRTSDPRLDPCRRAESISKLMQMRRAVGVVRRAGDAERQAHDAVDHAKIALGERGPVWWDGGAPDFTRHMVKNTPYADWFAALLDASADLGIVTGPTGRFRHGTMFLRRNLRRASAIGPSRFGAENMSILDKAIAAITPPESDEARAEARAKAEAAATPGDWLSMVLDHHRQIDAAFDTLERAGDSASRAAAQKALGTILTAHSIAEEVALYPALAADHQVGHAELAYQEQSAAKMEMGLLERLDPMSQDYEDKLGHIRGAVMHHVYSEEGTWFLDLAESLPADEQARIGARYKEEFERYMGDNASLAAPTYQPSMT